VPQRWARNPKFASWVHTQRLLKKRGKLSLEQEAKLNSLGFLWDPFDEAWARNISELKQFHAEHGHCNVPDDSLLGRWAGKLRQKRNKLSTSRVAQLEELGFAWDPHEASWDRWYIELERYRREHGNCNVSSRSKEHGLLGNWVSNQRALYKRGKVSSARKARLDALGFAWHPDDHFWESNLAKLESFKDLHGHCNVPRGWDLQLGVWVTTLRLRQKRGHLSEERKAQLDKLGFPWDPRGSRWDTNFAKLKSFKDRHGHCNVPEKWDKDPQLGTWVNGVRGRRDKLSAERRAQLDSLGFTWNSTDQGWEAMFAQLKRYKQRFGDCAVPSKWSENPQLGAWVGKQRQQKTKITKSKRESLEALGFVWSRKR
jgi:Helicase associated domain